MQLFEPVHALGRCLLRLFFRMNTLGNGLAALTAFSLEGLILSVRLFVYFQYEADREKNLARQYAITPDDYLQKMLQAGFGSLSAFGMSIVGISIGSSLFVGTLSPTICSIFFGFLGYLAARWLTGLIVVRLRRKVSTYVFVLGDVFFSLVSRIYFRNEKSIAFKNAPGDDDDVASLN